MKLIVIYYVSELPFRRHTFFHTYFKIFFLDFNSYFRDYFFPFRSLFFNGIHDFLITDDFPSLENVGILKILVAVFRVKS